MAFFLVTGSVIGALGIASKSNKRSAREHVLSYARDWRDETRAGQ